MPRYKLTVEYDGAAFVGWQSQDTGPSVQATLEAAARAFGGGDPLVQGAGRTDSGVHALGQVAHVDLPRDDSPERVRKGLNFHLKPAPVAVLTAEKVAEDFHARFWAVERAYLYRLLNRPAPPALERGRVWWVPQPLDVAAMQAAAAVLVGPHDFTTFRATACQARSAVKTLDALTVDRVGEELHVRTRARSFLHHQVRNMVGTLVLVGRGKWSVDRVRTALAARNRAAGGPTAPADGLYLTAVGYGVETPDPT